MKLLFLGAGGVGGYFGGRLVEAGVRFVMPDLIGTFGARSAAVLRARGFRVALTAEVPYPGLPAGIVVRQTPQAGFQIALEEPISIEVSR